MKNRIMKILTFIFLTLVVPVLALAAELPPLKANAVFRTIMPDLKLRAVNTMLQSLKMSPATAVPPAKVVLSPVNPVVYNNYLILVGSYVPKSNTMAVMYNSGHLIKYFFETIPGKTYLLDISVEADSKWHVYHQSGGSMLPIMKDQQGHLLIPFIAGYNVNQVTLYPAAPYPGAWCAVGNAELTQIN